jgi:hypothetical protein
MSEEKMIDITGTSDLAYIGAESNKNVAHKMKEERKKERKKERKMRL